MVTDHGNMTVSRQVTISVNKFEKKMVYDPTADVSEQGGTGSDDGSDDDTDKDAGKADYTGSASNPVISVIVLLLAYLLH